MAENTADKAAAEKQNALKGHHPATSQRTFAHDWDPEGDLEPGDEPGSRW
jgi:hypothetical protein